MRWPAAALLAPVGVNALLATAACGRPSAADYCPPGQASYQPTDVALTLDSGDQGRSFRLPLGKIVTAIVPCEAGDALQRVASTGLPAFRAVAIGKAAIYSVNSQCGGETCLQDYRFEVTVTEGCVIRSPDDLMGTVVVPPRWGPQGSSPLPPQKLVAAKLIMTSDYSRIFHTALDLQPETLVWALLYIGVSEIPPSPEPVVTALYTVAVDACTDWRSVPVQTETNQPGWSSVFDHAPQNAGPS